MCIYLNTRFVSRRGVGCDGRFLPIFARNSDDLYINVIINCNDRSRFLFVYDLSFTYELCELNNAKRLYYC